MTTWHDDTYDDLDAYDLDAPYQGDGTIDGFETHDLGFGTYDIDADLEGDGTFGSDGTDRLTALMSDATGVRFETLAAFARPLFARYGIEAETALADGDETVVTLLETARLLWAYFSLDEAARDDRRAALLAHCYGPDADVEAWEDFADLLTAMEEAWEALAPEARAEAEATDAPTLDFDALLVDDAEADGLAECDARALFALPLLDDPDVQADPARFEAALHRADTYWSLAQTENPTDRLAAVLPTLATSPAEVPTLRIEAETMLARYDELFG